ncbi:MAG: hypothetical protein Q9M91_08515 [Candidatus Dojkabacteria bacterium]|nr:hypothetical protein [Candidatus Dojkabacteria bacterium]
MKFYSTRNHDNSVNFEEALLKGLASDGGLYFPEIIPKFTDDEIKGLENMNLLHVAYLVLEKWFGDEISSDGLREIVSEASNFEIPIVNIAGINIVDLTHGPTMAFKDVAARYLSLLMRYLLKKEK